MPLEAQDLIFQVDQAAAIEAQFPQSARAVQQIQMIQRANGGLARFKR